MCIHGKRENYPVIITVKINFSEGSKYLLPGI